MQIVPVRLQQLHKHDRIVPGFAVFNNSLLDGFMFDSVDNSVMSETFLTALCLVSVRVGHS